MILAGTGGRYVPGTKTPIRLTRQQILDFRDLLKLLAGPAWEACQHDGRRHTVRLGRARGTDAHLEELCKRWGIDVDPVPVDTTIDGPWPAAGHRRNYRMLHKEPRVQALIAFPGGRGTAGCRQVALRMGIWVFDWTGVGSTGFQLTEAARQGSRGFLDRCPIHFLPEPCPRCEVLKAAGL